MIHEATPADADAIIAIAEASGLFGPEDLAAFAPMIREGIGGEALWLTGDGGAAMAEAEPFADRVWNLRFIAVLPQARRQGTGAALLAAAEARLREQGARLLLIDTSGGEGQAGARAFYLAQGYTLEARVRGYYGEGEDRVTFLKAL